MMRACVTGWVVFVIALALIANSAAHAGSSVRAPSHPDGDCAWTENGAEVEVDGFVYQCMCEKVQDAGEYWCHWALVKSPARAAKKPRKPLAKPKARYGVGGGVISVKPVTR